jgi:hypothetical protein
MTSAEALPDAQRISRGPIAIHLGRGGTGLRSLSAALRSLSAALCSPGTKLRSRATARRSPVLQKQAVVIGARTVLFGVRALALEVRTLVFGVRVSDAVQDSFARDVRDPPANRTTSGSVVPVSGSEDFAPYTDLAAPTAEADAAHADPESLRPRCTWRGGELHIGGAEVAVAETEPLFSVSDEIMANREGLAPHPMKFPRRLCYPRRARDDFLTQPPVEANLVCCLIIAFGTPAPCRFQADTHSPRTPATRVRRS